MSQETTSSEVHTGHPTSVLYFKIAMILSTVTAIEVGIFYLEWLGHWIIPVLFVLSAGKFALVAMYYMHLKFEHKIFSILFVGGFMLAATVIIALMVLFKSLF
tara:strand:- start:554 stop:862 length:309 start_codon:yes stop_codon:yes gene_type:complete